jgi:hypothetical protein
MSASQRSLFALLLIALIYGGVTRAGSAPDVIAAEVAATPSDELAWRGHDYSVLELGEAIRSAKLSENIGSVVLLHGESATVEDIVDVAKVAHAAGLPAFYARDGKLNRIEISE